jgi:hypothetical protein
MIDMTLSGDGALRLSLLLEWDEYTKEHGLKNPYKKRNNVLIANSDKMRVTSTGVIYENDVEAQLPPKEECENWNKMEYEFVARGFLKEAGYDGFLRQVEFARGAIDYLIDEICPCEADDGQCHMDCRYYEGGCTNDFST